jgi:hypothetical protein
MRAKALQAARAAPDSLTRRRRVSILSCFFCVRLLHGACGSLQQRPPRHLGHLGHLGHLSLGDPRTTSRWLLSLWGQLSMVDADVLLWQQRICWNVVQGHRQDPKRCKRLALSQAFSQDRCSQARFSQLRVSPRPQEQPNSPARPSVSIRQHSSAYVSIRQHTLPPQRRPTLQLVRLGAMLRPHPKDKHATASMRASLLSTLLLRNAHSRTRESARERVRTRESARASDQRFSKWQVHGLERFGRGTQEGKGSHTSDYLTTPVFLRPNTPPPHHHHTHTYAYTHTHGYSEAETNLEI